MGGGYPMDIENEIVETLQEASSLLYLLEADISIHKQDRMYGDTVKVVRGLLKSAIDELEKTT